MELPKRIKINNRIYYLKAEEFPGSEYYQFSSGYFDDNDEIAECESGYLIAVSSKSMKETFKELKKQFKDSRLSLKEDSDNSQCLWRDLSEEQKQQYYNSQEEAYKIILSREYISWGDAFRDWKNEFARLVSGFWKRNCGYLTDFKKQIDKFGKPKMKTTMIGKVIDVEIDGRIISGEVVKEDKDSVLIDMDGDLKRVFKTDLP